MNRCLCKLADRILNEFYFDRATDFSHPQVTTDKEFGVILPDGFPVVAARRPR